MEFKGVVAIAFAMLFLAFLLAVLGMYTTEVHLDFEKLAVLRNNVTYLLTLRNFSKEIHMQVESTSLCIDVHDCSLHYSMAIPNTNYSFSGVVSNSTCIALPSSRFTALFSVTRGGTCDALFKLRVIASTSPFWYASVVSLILLIVSNVVLLYVFVKRKFTS